MPPSVAGSALTKEPRQAIEKRLFHSGSEHFSGGCCLKSTQHQMTRFVPGCRTSPSKIKPSDARTYTSEHRAELAHFARRIGTANGVAAHILERRRPPFIHSGERQARDGAMIRRLRDMPPRRTAGPGRGTSAEGWGAGGLMSRPRRLRRDDFSSTRHSPVAYSLCTVFFENRYPPRSGRGRLSGIMPD